MFPAYLGLGKSRVPRPYPAEAMMFTSPGTLGSFDVTLPAEVSQGKTPIAAFFMHGGASSEYVVSVGAFDGTNQWLIASLDEDGKGTTSSLHIAFSNQVARTLDSSLNAHVVSASALIPGGVRLSVDQTGAAPGSTTVVLFFDGQGQSKVGTYAPAAVGSSKTISVGFSASAILSSISYLSQFGSGAGNNTSLNIGFATPSGDQASVGNISENGKSTSVLGGAVRDDAGAIHGRDDNRHGWLNYHSFTGTSFDAKSHGDLFANAEVGYLALHMPGAQFGCGIYSTPSAAGRDSHNAGFRAQTTLFGVNTLGAVNTQKSDSTAESIGLGVGVNQAENLAVRGASRDNSSPASSTETVVESSDITAAKESSRPSPEPTKANQYKAVTNGWSLNFTAAPVARQWPYLSIGVK